ncbi:MAG: hypothetical protein K1X55_03935 [Chitinophagales bacterium]|nr:hypothetical protein [Chitinophagales bacterium]
MRKLSFSIVFFFAVIICFTACYNDNEEDLYDEYLANCTVESASFKDEVSLIFISKCDRCHSEANAPINGDNINLDGYEKIVAFENKYPGLLVRSLKHESGVAAMPKGEKKLDACNVRKVEFWVLDGMKNN